MKRSGVSSRLSERRGNIKNIRFRLLMFYPSNILYTIPTVVKVFIAFILLVATRACPLASSGLVPQEDFAVGS